MRNLNLNKKRLKEFIVKAKQSTYASIGEIDEAILVDSAKELIFQEKELEYRDRYFGSDSFIGQEIIFQNKEPIWGMNYYGKIITKFPSAKEIYKFLQKALKMVAASEPFRGPANLINGDFCYVNKSEGIIETFKGSEIIFYKNKMVYELHYHGGLIFKKSF